MSESITERIRNGSFTPKPDNEAAAERIRSGGRRNDQPFVTAIKSEKSKDLLKGLLGQ